MYCLHTGFMLKEIEKADIVIQDTSENPEAPHPNEMMELEVDFFLFKIPIEMQ